MQNNSYAFYCKIKNLFGFKSVLIYSLLMTSVLSLAQTQTAKNTDDLIQVNKLRVLAQNYQKNKQYKESIIIYQTLIKVQPQNLSLHLDLALSYYYNQEFESAKNEIHFVRSHPGFTNAPELVKKNVQKLYENVLEKISAKSFKDPTFPSNNKTWDAFLLLSGTNKSTTLINLEDELEDNKIASNLVAYHLFINHKNIKPVENYRIDQNIHIYQQLEKRDTHEDEISFTNLNYNIGYKKVLSGQKIFSSEVSAIHSSSPSQSYSKQNLGFKVGYQFNNHQLLLTTSHHWLAQLLEEEDLTQTHSTYWANTFQYKSKKEWSFVENIDSLAINWKTKLTNVTDSPSYNRIEQLLGTDIEVNDKVKWNSQFQFLYQEEYGQVENEASAVFRWNQSAQYFINDNWQISLMQQFKNYQSSKSDNDYDQWLYQLTLKWVN